MNIVGKILAFLNLIFAVIVAGLLAMFLTTSTNWKTYAEKKDRDLQAAVHRSKIWEDSAKIAENKYQASRKQTGEYAKFDVGKFDEYKANELKYKILAETERNTRLEAEISLTEAKAAVERRTKEAETNRELIGKLSQDLRDVSLALDKSKNDLQTLKTQFTTMQGRADTALAEVKELRRKLFELEAKGTDTAAAPKVMNTKEPNPPSRAVLGKVLRADGADVHVDVGLDHGVQDNNTLEIFRVMPKAEYVGVLRISKSYAREAVGRLQPIAGVVRAVRAGDTVADSLERR